MQIFITNKNIVFNFLLGLLFVFYFFSNQINLDQFNYEDCRNNIGIQTINYQIEKEDIYLSENINNLFCLGKITKITENDNNYTLYIGTNPNISHVTKFTILGIFFLSLLIKKNWKNNLYIFIVFLTYFLKLIEFPMYSFREFFFVYRLVILLYLIVLNLMTNNTKLKIFSLLYFIFIEYNYFGIFFLVMYITKKLNFEKNNNNEVLVKFFGLGYLLFRYITGVNEHLYSFWSNLTQFNYLVPVRFWDSQWFFAKLKCNFNESLEYYFKFSRILFDCPTNYSYGPVTEILSLNVNIWQSTLVLTLLNYIVLYYLFLILIQRYPNYSLIILFSFFSPPMNFLLDRSNIDLFILLISLFIFIKFEKLTYFKTFLLFLISILKIHVVGATIGLLFYAIKKQNKKYIFLSSISLTGFIFTYVFTLINFDSRSVPPARKFDLAYGILGDSFFISEKLGLNLIMTIGLVLFVIILFLISLFKINKNKLPELKDYELIFYVYGAWFLFTNVYENYAYRYPIFFILFFLLFKKSDSAYLKVAIIGTISLLPIPVTYVNLQYLLFVLHRLSHYYVVVYILLSLSYDFLSNLKKTNLT